MKNLLLFHYCLVFFFVSSSVNANTGKNGKMDLVGPPWDGPWYVLVDVEVNTPLIGALAKGDNIFNTRAVSVRVGAEKGRIGMFGFIERGQFKEPSYDSNVSNDLLGLGVGASWSYFQQRMRSMILLGTTILLNDSFQNDRGTMGFYSELRPAGFLFRFGELNFQLYPITFNWLIPVLQNIPLFYVHFRTAVSVGGTF